MWCCSLLGPTRWSPPTVLGGVGCSAVTNFTWCGCCTYVSDFVFEVVWNTFFALYIQDLELRIQQFYLCYGKPLRKLCVCVCVCVYMRTTVCDQ